MSRLPEFWCSRRLLVTVEGPQGNSVIPLARPLARIGREPGSDIVLNSPWVARRSLYLHASDEGVFCFYFQPEEMQSQRLGFWLAPGEPLLVGPYRISACLEGDPPGPAPAFVPMDEWGSAVAPYPMFQVYAGGKLCARRRFRARLNLIGRRHQCALQIKGQQVSSFHGCLYWQFPRLWYVDLVSSNGTLCNGRKIDCCEVHVGDRLEVGEFTLLYQRLSHGGPRGAARSGLPVGQQTADVPCSGGDGDLPPEQDGPSAIDGDVQARDDARSSTVGSLGQHGVASTMTTMHRTLKPTPLSTAPASPVDQTFSLPPAAIDQVLTDPAAVTGAPALDETAPAVVQQMRQELAVLQRRVEELQQFAAKAVENAAQQMALENREAFAQERQRIAGELERRAGDLAAEKAALEARWQSASADLAAQSGQLRDAVALLALQHQAMEESRLLWDAQRSELEQRLQTYARQLQRLEHREALGLPAPMVASVPGPAAANGWKPAGSLSLRATRPYSLPALSPGHGTLESDTTKAPLLPAPPPGSLTARNRIVDAHLDGAALGQVLESPATDAAIAPAASNAAPPEQSAAAGSNGRRRKSRDVKAFDLVTGRMVEMEQGRRRKMIVLGIAGTLLAVALASAMIVAAVLLR